MLFLSKADKKSSPRVIRTATRKQPASAEGKKTKSSMAVNAKADAIAGPSGGTGTRPAGPSFVMPAIRSLAAPHQVGLGA